MVEIFKEWLKAANDDLLVATNILDNELLTHMVAFHSQQIVIFQI